MPWIDISNFSKSLLVMSVVFLSIYFYTGPHVAPKDAAGLTMLFLYALSQIISYIEKAPMFSGMALVAAIEARSKWRIFLLISNCVLLVFTIGYMYR